MVEDYSDLIAAIHCNLESLGERMRSERMAKWEQNYKQKHGIESFNPLPLEGLKALLVTLEKMAINKLTGAN